MASKTATRCDLVVAEPSTVATDTSTPQPSACGIAAGKSLLLLKTSAPHGHFGAVLADLHEKHGIAERTANLYMAIARRWSELEDRVPGLADYSLRRIQQMMVSRQRGPKTDQLLTSATVDDLVVEACPKTEGVLTHPTIIDAVVEAFRGTIDFDAASEAGKSHVPAKNHLTETDNGLGHVWHGRTFVHPPHEADLLKWVEHAGVCIANSEVDEVILLLPARTDAPYFARLAELNATVVFLAVPGVAAAAAATPQFPMLLAYLGYDPTNYIAATRQLGPVLMPVPPSTPVAP
jgi:hypothetical protein